MIELEVGKRTRDLFLYTSQKPERTAWRQCGFHPLPEGSDLTPQSRKRAASLRESENFQANF
jgi:hypothetical protein